MSGIPSNFNNQLQDNNQNLFSNNQQNLFYVSNTQNDSQIFINEPFINPQMNDQPNNILNNQQESNNVRIAQNGRNGSNIGYIVYPILCIFVIFFIGFFIYLFSIMSISMYASDDNGHEE